MSVSSRRGKAKVPENHAESLIPANAAPANLRQRRLLPEAPKAADGTQAQDGGGTSLEEQMQLLSTRLQKGGLAPNWATSLYPFQAEGCAWMALQEHNMAGGLMCDEMGLGKTLQVTAMVALRGAREEGCEGGTLIICPKSLIPVWSAAFGLAEGNLAGPAYMARGKLKVLEWHGPARPYEPEVLSSFDIIISNVQTFQSKAERNPLAGKMALTRMIIDESTIIKNPKTVAFSTLHSVNARHRWCVSATPMANGIQDMYSHLRMIRYSSAWQMEDRGGKPSEVKKAKKLTARQLEWWKSVLSDVALMRSKEACTPGLLPKVMRLERLALSPAERDAYARYTNNEGAGEIELVKMLRQRQIVNRTRRSPFSSEVNRPAGELQNKVNATGESATEWVSVKLERLIKIVSAEVRRTEASKIIVFSQLVEALHLIRDILEEDFEIRSKMYEGGMSDAARKESVKDWEKSASDGGVQVLLVSLSAGGEGITLLGGPEPGPRMVILYDHWWNDARELQAINRMHRVNQKNEVTVVKFVVEATVERRMAEIKAEKSDIIDSITELIRNRALPSNIISTALEVAAMKSETQTSVSSLLQPSQLVPRLRSTPKGKKKANEKTTSSAVALSVVTTWHHPHLSSSKTERFSTASSRGAGGLSDGQSGSPSGSEVDNATSCWDESMCTASSRAR